MITEALRASDYRVAESVDLWDRFVSFEHDELLDEEGYQVWSKIGLQDFGTGATSVAYKTEAELTAVRNQCRWLSQNNPFAINLHENRISYVVGEGHAYKVEAIPGETLDDATLDEVRRWFDEWQRANNWQQRQQEMVSRRDRDGEVFLRYFPQDDGLLLVRFIEPEQIKTPQEKASQSDTRFGIQFAEDDAETPVGYYVSSLTGTKMEPVEAALVQHRKANVDCTSPRGLPTLFSIRRNLRRVESMLRNMSRLIEMRAAVAWTIEHAAGSPQKAQEFIANMADVVVTSAKGATTNYRKYRPGTILHHPAGQKYEFPSHQTDVTAIIGAIQAELRAVASRFVMPEFMLTSDASNANYASTMVAEGPAVKMFLRLQQEMIWHDEQVIDVAIQHAVAVKRLSEDVMRQVRIVAQPPSVQVRDRLKDAQADQILAGARVLSPQTFAARHGLDYDAEQENFEQADERETGFGVAPKPEDFDDGEEA
jgi:hypothetical protein